MAFEKTQSATRQREKFDLYNQNDKKEVLLFEEELKPYFEKERTIFGKILKGFDLYLHDNGMFVLSVKYPDGAVRMDKLEEYRIANMKYSGLTELWDKRQEAQRKEAERLQTLI